MRRDLSNHFSCWPERCCKKSINCEFWFRTLMLPCIFYHSPDSCPRLLNEGDPVKKVGYERVSSYTPSTEFFFAQPLWQPSRVANLNPIVVDFNKNVSARFKVVPVDDSIGDCFAKRTRGILG